MSAANIFGEATKATVGKANVKFYIGGVHQPGADFDTKDVHNFLSGFAAFVVRNSLRIGYGSDLPDGAHTVEVAPREGKYLRLELNGQVFETTGKVSVTVSNQQAKQVGNFEVHFTDGLGRKVDAKGDYEVEYSFP